MTHEIAPIEDIDPRNVLALVSDAVRNHVIKTYEAHPEWMNMHEHDLELICNPSINSTLIRVAFWDEYKRAQDHGKHMVISKIYEGVMAKESFYTFLTHPKNVAWMMCPPADEFLQMKADAYKARQEYSKVLRASLIHSKGENKGEVNIRLAKLSLDIYRMYSDRIHGAVVQRIEKKVQNIPANDLSGDADEIRKRILELEAITIDVKKTNNEG